VIQPGVERVTDPTFQAGVRGYVSEAGRTIGQAGQSANSWGRNQFGVDVAGQIGSLVGTDRAGGRSGYDRVSQGRYEGEETSALYRDDDEDDMFHDAFEDTRASSTSAGKPTPAHKAGDGWDEDWKEF